MRQAGSVVDGGVLEARQVGREVQVVLDQQQVVGELQVEGDRAVLPGDEVAGTSRPPSRRR